MVSLLARTVGYKCVGGIIPNLVALRLVGSDVTEEQIADESEKEHREEMGKYHFTWCMHVYAWDSNGRGGL